MMMMMLVMMMMMMMTMMMMTMMMMVKMTMVVLWCLDVLMKKKLIQSAFPQDVGQPPSL